MGLYNIAKRAFLAVPPLRWAYERVVLQAGRTAAARVERDRERAVAKAVQQASGRADRRHERALAKAVKQAEDKLHETYEQRIEQLELQIYILRSDLNRAVNEAEGLRDALFASEKEAEALKSKRQGKPQ